MHHKQLDDLYARWSLAPNGLFDAIIQAVMAEFIAPGDRVLEVGANIGIHTRAMAEAVGPEGRVWAFEPVPANLKALKGRLGAAGLLERVAICEYALSNYTGEAEFKVFPESLGLSGFKERPWYDKSAMSVIRVKVDQIDQVIDPAVPVRFIKIDAEGADLDILRGARETLARHRPVAVFEGGRVKSNPGSMYGYDASSFAAFFDDLGYEVHDSLGLRFDYAMWDKPGLNDFVVLPREGHAETHSRYLACVFQVLMAAATGTPAA